MTLPIGSPAPSTGADRAQQALRKALRQLSSGARITRAGDDVAGLAISEQLHALERGFSQGQRNLSDGISVTRTAGSALEQMSSLTIRMRELSVQAGNGTLSDEAQSAIQKEFDTLSSEVTRISASTEFAGRKLLNGDSQGAEALTLRDGSGGDDIVQISLEDHSAAALSLDGLDASDPATLDALDSALSKISDTRATLGATERRLESGIRTLATARENTLDARSRIHDADFARASSDRTRAQILENAAVATQVHKNLSASVVLDLLR